MEINKEDINFIDNMNLNKWKTCSDKYWAIWTKVNYYVNKNYEQFDTAAKISKREKLIQLAQIKFTKKGDCK